MYTVPTSVELEQAFEKSFEEDPTSNSWGFFAYDDTPGAAGGGAGNFSWFSSQNDLIAFLKKFPLLAHTAASDGTGAFEKASDCLSHVTAANFDQMVVDELNKINTGVEQIQWLGPLDELLSGEGDFAMGLRKFHAGSTKKLEKRQIPEFSEFLRNWGH